MNGAHEGESLRYSSLSRRFLTHSQQELLMNNSDLRRAAEEVYPTRLPRRSKRGPKNRQVMQFFAELGLSPQTFKKPNPTPAERVED